MQVRSLKKRPEPKCRPSCLQRRRADRRERRPGAQRHPPCQIGAAHCPPPAIGDSAMVRSLRHTVSYFFWILLRRSIQFPFAGLCGFRLPQGRTTRPIKQFWECGAEESFSGRFLLRSGRLNCAINDQGRIPSADETSPLMPAHLLTSSQLELPGAQPIFPTQSTGPATRGFQDLESQCDGDSANVAGNRLELRVAMAQQFLDAEDDDGLEAQQPSFCLKARVVVQGELEELKPQAPSALNAEARSRRGATFSCFDSLAEKNRFYGSKQRLAAPGVAAPSSGMWQTYVGPEHELGEWLRSKKVRRHKHDFRLTAARLERSVNADYQSSFEICTWITPGLIQSLDKCRREVYSVELWEKSSGNLAAVIMALSVGDIFHDYTTVPLGRALGVGAKDPDCACHGASYADYRYVVQMQNSKDADASLCAVMKGRSSEMVVRQAHQTPRHGERARQKLWRYATNGQEDSDRKERHRLTAGIGEELTPDGMFRRAETKQD
ncbi:hypothetical protein AK812_SmicGene10276 [Symbiodinium microadriaticum]|uniref:Uncharacterized protein n=1 Tax=Symbiodinium microadriaticum TaxID=2951 RepID=A0A1Q9EGB4_SYMMI|nr:hypothetical protein AK812_SmicGene10276 [Symbiodinium microadriaticum]